MSVIEKTYKEKQISASKCSYRRSCPGSKIKLYDFSQFFSSANANDNKVNNAALFLAIYVGRFFVAHLLGFQSNRRDVCYCYHGFLSVLLWLATLLLLSCWRNYLYCGLLYEAVCFPIYLEYLLCSPNSINNKQQYH